MTEETPLLYKNFINYGEWLKEMKDLLSADQIMIHRYKELYLSKGIEEKKRELYHQAILGCADNVTKNLAMMEAAEIESGLTVFYMEDGLPYTANVTEDQKKILDAKMRETRELYGR